MRAAWALGWLLGCRAPHDEAPTYEGIAVGNPTNLAVELRIAPDGTWSMEQLVWNTRASLVGADGEEVVLADDELDLLAGERLEASVAPFSAIRLEGAAPLNALGTTAGGQPVHLVLELSGVELALDPGSETASSYVLELGAPDWLDLAPDADRVNVTRGQPEHDAVVNALVEGTRLYPDFDADGAVSDDERDHPLGAPSAYGDDR
jgi:hypothetical protein